MKLGNSNLQIDARRKNASVLIIVLWIAIGLVAIALYFANSMTYELRASDNRVSGLEADQAIEGAARYVGYVLSNYATNGAMPDSSQFSCANVPIGDSHFWLIGRDLSAVASGSTPTEPVFGLVDEGGKLNLNTVNTNVLSYLPDMSGDFAQAIMDWRGTNGVVSLDYATLGYYPKNAPFETVDELRLVYGASEDLLAGDDLNRNGVLDANEKSSAGTGEINYGLFEYTTVWTREPNFHSDGSSLTNVNTADRNQLTTWFESAGIGNASGLAQSLWTDIHASTPGRTPPPRNCNGTLDLAHRLQEFGMSEVDFGKIYNDVTTSTNTYIRNRVNVNTANPDVLTALFEGLNIDEQTASGAAQTLVTYREQNPGNINTIWWLMNALGNNNPVITALARGNYVTTRSYQFTADIAAVGPFGRGYRRVKFIFDISNGSPIILYRQDLSRLGWALGEKARQTLLASNTDK
jgi:type II secretory pathway component PulK